jgi:adenylylsulfate kinase
MNADQRLINPSYPDLGRFQKERNLHQHGRAIWLFGLSGSGKSTLATELDSRLAQDGFTTALLDGDHLRAGLNRGLGFSEADRAENLRRAAEAAKLFVEAGIVAICSFITPLRANRAMIREIIGPDDFLGVYLAATYAVCAQRDTKGLYHKAATNQISQFTGHSAPFEALLPDEVQCVIDTGTTSIKSGLNELYSFVAPHLRSKS